MEKIYIQSCKYFEARYGSGGTSTFYNQLIHVNNICNVTKEEYFAAAELAEELKMDPNDALAVDLMRVNNIKEIYSFDTDFDKISGISRLPKYQTA